MVASNHENFTHEIYFTTNNSVMSMTAHFHTAAMRLFYVTVMAPLRYLDGVLTAREVRSVFISPSHTIAEANLEVQEATSGSSKKRGPSSVTASQISW